MVEVWVVWQWFSVAMVTAAGQVVTWPLGTFVVSFPIFSTSVVAAAAAVVVVAVVAVALSSLSVRHSAACHLTPTYYSNPAT